MLATNSSDKKQLLLTKGDNNPMDDLDLYAYKQMYLDREADISGVVKAYVPKLGYATILMTENQYAKFAILGTIFITSFLQRE
jgi:signal peptidase